MSSVSTVFGAFYSLFNLKKKEKRQPSHINGETLREEATLEDERPRKRQRGALGLGVGLGVGVGVGVGLGVGGVFQNATSGQHLHPHLIPAAP